MKAFPCQCGLPLYFNSCTCVKCGSLSGNCPGCRQISSLRAVGDGNYECTRCQCALTLCDNRIKHAVCNGVVDSSQPGTRCRYCNLNEVIPDLAVDGNLEKWNRIERAKHRVLFDCERLGLSFGDEGEDPLPLIFHFKSSLTEPVSTGHASGVITIDTEEADSVNREQIRVQFGEPQRTLVGHFRHELGHYYWERMVPDQCLNEYRALFGDETNPTYSEAKDEYYKNGPREDWRSHFISQYASMHSWEDFAESFNTYLDMVAIVGTASFFPSTRITDARGSFERLLDSYIEIGIVANEFNRDMGLIDLVPEVLNTEVVEKLRFVHQMIHREPVTVATDKLAETSKAIGSA